MDRAEDVLAHAEGAVLRVVLAPWRAFLSLRAEVQSWQPDDEVEVAVEAGIWSQWRSRARLYRRQHALAPVTVLVLLVATYIAVFGTLTYRQQSNYGTFGFDMGIYDQGIWLVSHFKTPFDTIRGLNYFGQHVNIITLLFVPAYWLGAGPHFLFAVETVWLALGAVPIWLLGKDRLGSPWLPLGLSAAYLLYPTVEWINQWMFHPDALIITPLMFAYWLATKKRWGWFWLATAMALSCKEDAGLAVLGLGVVLWLKVHQRAWGVVTAIAGGAWFLICTKLIIPLANGGGQPFYVNLFPGFGTSVFEIIKNLVVHPSRLWGKLSSATSWTYYGQLLWPVALLSLLAPSVLLIAVPQLVVNVISGEGYTTNITSGGYYSSILVAAVFLATVEACAQRPVKRAGRSFMVGLVVAASLACNIAWSPSPISVKFRNGEWASASPQDLAKNAAIALVPKDASVSATYDMDDHMTHRVLIYEYPNPWVVSYYGLNGSGPFRAPNPARVDWLVLNTDVVSPGASELYEALEKREFKVVFDQQGILVLHRVKPGVPNDHKWPCTGC
jgi:uncharacterized membrane protein